MSVGCYLTLLLSFKLVTLWNLSEHLAKIPRCLPIPPPRCTYVCPINLSCLRNTPPGWVANHINGLNSNPAIFSATSSIVCKCSGSLSILTHRLLTRKTLNANCLGP